MSLAATATAKLVEELSGAACDTVSVIEAATWLGTTQRNVRKWLAQGQLEAGLDVVTGVKGVLICSVQNFEERHEAEASLSRRQRNRHLVNLRGTRRARSRESGPAGQPETPPRCAPLMAMLEEVEDSRRRQGRRYQLSALLAMTSCAVLCGCRSFSSISTWCENQRSLLQQFFEVDAVPTSHTLHLVFRGLDRTRLEAGLTEWALSALRTLDPGMERPPRSLYIRDGRILPGRYSSRIPGLVALTELGERIGLQEAGPGRIKQLDGAGVQLLRVLLFEGSQWSSPSF